MFNHRKPIKTRRNKKRRVSGMNLHTRKPTHRNAELKEDNHSCKSDRKANN